MGRPRLHTGGGSRAVVESAVAHFFARGYHGTSMRDIASGAGVTVASIYHHFPSKQAILQHIMTTTLTEVVELTRRAVASADDSEGERLGSLVEAWVGFHASRGQEALISAAEIRSLEEPGRARVVALRDEQEQLFRDVVAAGVASGEFRTAHPLEAARGIIAMGYAVVNWYRTDGPTSASDLARQYRDLALATVQPTRREGGRG